MKILNYWKPILLAIVILYGSTTSSANLNKVNFLDILYFDKIAHFLLYFTFSITLYASLFRQKLFKKLKNIVITLTITISYGLLMESFQYLFTSDRSPEILDVCANTLGSIFSITIFPLLVRLNLEKYL